MKLLEKIFSAKNTYIYKDFTILGKQIRCINTITIGNNKAPPPTQLQSVYTRLSELFLIFFLLVPSLEVI